MSSRVFHHLHMIRYGCLFLRLAWYPSNIGTSRRIAPPSPSFIDISDPQSRMRLDLDFESIRTGYLIHGRRLHVTIGRHFLLSPLTPHAFAPPVFGAVRLLLFLGCALRWRLRAFRITHFLYTCFFRNSKIRLGSQSRQTHLDDFGDAIWNRLLLPGIADGVGYGFFYLTGHRVFRRNYFRRIYISRMR